MRKSDLSAQLLTAVTAMEDNDFAGKTLMLNDKPVKGAVVIKMFQDQIAMMKATDAARTSLLKASGAQKTADAPVRAALTALRQYIAAVYGKTSELYTAFGFPVPRPRAKPTIPTRTTALVQSQATRKARSTMGKKQRLAIKAVVQPQVSAPAVTSPSAPSANTPNGVNGQSK
jgi:hypothetical protein